tara:strand:- start:150 stop:686 length:537 start_codon:yes stop_codon:yes gene_type:complete
MAETKLDAFSPREKLNKMAVDLIDVTISLDADNAGTSAAGDLLFKVTEIPNAVAINGGCAILQSAVIVGATTIGPIDFIITSSSTALTEASDGSAAETGDAVAGFDNTLAELDATCGYFGISNSYDAGVVAIGDKKNIGMVCKAESASKSLYIYGIQQSSADYSGAANAVIRLGFVKD